MYVPGGSFGALGAALAPAPAPARLVLVAREHPVSASAAIAAVTSKVQGVRRVLRIVRA